MMESLAAWLEREYRYAAGAMLKSVSPTAIVKERPGFGQTIRPVKGAIVASPVLAAYDPDPDYFFHWYRDSAVVMDAMRLLCEAGALEREQALEHLGDFVRFSRSLRDLDGRELAAHPQWRQRIAPDFEQYVRDDADLRGVHGDAVVADTRVNPDGTLDISKWSRPQHDGPPLRALCVLRWARNQPLEGDVGAQAAALIRADLEFAAQRWREPSYDIWEEENGQHYYMLCVSAAALREGAAWLEKQGDREVAQRYRAESEQIRKRLEEFWQPEQRFYRSRFLASGARSTKELDIAVVLAAIHTAEDPAAPGSGTPRQREAGGAEGARHDSAKAHAARAHGPHDPRVHATLARLEEVFDDAYPINHDRPPGSGPAMGRYAGDVYYSGGAYYFSTLGAAELCFRAAAGRDDARNWIGKGDAFLATVRAFTPAGGELSEQFDQRTGSQTSARHLAWSYAAFISCVSARRAVAGNG